jgi:predicted RNase H-like HicB family nuclease
MSRALTEKGGKMDIQFTTQILKEGNTFVYAPELDLSSCGKTIQEAKVHLTEAVRLFIEEAQRMGTLRPARSLARGRTSGSH